MTNPRVYKYRSWKQEFHQKCLRSNELFFSSPAKINDPLDFKVSIDYTLLDTGNKREEYVEKLLREVYPVLVERGINPIEKKAELLWRLENDVERMQEEFDLTNNTWADKRFGVISFSTRWNSILMWSHYGDNHTGFCIGYNREKLEKSSFIGSCGPVRYMNDCPRIDPNENNPRIELLIKTFTKAVDWKYEEEYRITQLWPEFDPSEKERTIQIPDHFIEEVILGLCVSQENKKEIAECARAKNIPVFMIKRKPRSFELEKVQI